MTLNLLFQQPGAPAVGETVLIYLNPLFLFWACANHPGKLNFVVLSCLPVLEIKALLLCLGEGVRWMVLGVFAIDTEPRECPPSAAGVTSYFIIPR